MGKVVEILSPIAKAVVAAVVPILVVAVQDVVSSGADWVVGVVTAFLTSLAVWAKANGPSQ